MLPHACSISLTASSRSARSPVCRNTVSTLVTWLLPVRFHVRLLLPLNSLVSSPAASELSIRWYHVRAVTPY